MDEKKKRKRYSTRQVEKHHGLFKKDSLKHINDARALAGMKPLTLEDLTKTRRVVKGN